MAGCCGCIQSCRITDFHYKQLALRENDDFQHAIKLSNAEVIAILAL